MSNKNNINKKPTIKVNKDNKYFKKYFKKTSTKTDYFVNCRSCKQYIKGDFRSNSDNRYCQNCL